MFNVFDRIYDIIYTQIVSIPLDNPLSTIYVVLNFILTLLAPFLESGAR